MWCRNIFVRSIEINDILPNNGKQHVQIISNILMKSYLGKFAVKNK